MRSTIPLQAAKDNSVRQLERNGRKIYMPAELSINPERFMRTKAFQDDQSKNSKLEPNIRSNNGFNPAKACYLPLLQESATAREVREQKAKNDLIAAHGMFRKSRFQHNRVLSNEEIRLKEAEIAHAKLVKDEKATSAIMMDLDCRDIETLRTFFERKGHVVQEEFVKEMLHVLPSSRTNTPETKIEVTMQLCALFRRADVQDEGELSWNDFCSFIARNSDEMYSTEGKAVNEYGTEESPPPIPMSSEVNGLFFIPDLDHLVVLDSKAKCTFRVFEASTNKLVFDVKEPKNADLLDALYLPNQRYLVAATSLPLISFYDTNHYRVRQQIPTECVQTALASNRNGTDLFSASSDGLVHLWNLETLTRRHSFFHKTSSAGGDFMTDLAYIESIEQIGCGSIDGHIYMVDVQSSRTIKTLAGHKKGIAALKYCQEYGYLISGGIDHCVQVWNPHLEQKIGSLGGHRSEIIGIEIVENTPEVVTADASGVIKIWDLRKFAAVQTIVKELYVKQQNSYSGLQKSVSARSRNRGVLSSILKGNIISNGNGNTSNNGAGGGMQGMRAMCYMSLRQRLAIADHSVYFLDAINGSQYLHVQNQISVSDEDEGVEQSGKGLNIAALAVTTATTDVYKTLQVLYNAPSACFVTFTAKHMKCWDATSGKLVRYFENLLSPCEITCACDVDGGYSYVIGTYEGKLFRVIMPSGSIMLEKQVHTAEVTAIKPFIDENRRLVISSSVDGNIIISTFEALENVHVLNHWRGVQSVFGLTLTPSLSQTNPGSMSTYVVPTKGRRNSSLPEAQRWRRRVSNIKSLPSEPSASTTATATPTVSPLTLDDGDNGVSGANSTAGKEEEPYEYSVPASARSLFVGKEFDRLKQLFSTFDTQSKGSIPVHELPLLLEKAFPTGSSINELASAKAQAGKAHQQTMVTFIEILELLHERIHKSQEKGWSMAEISTIALSVQKNLLLSASSSDATFCLWNLKNNTALEQGVNQPGSMACISSAVFLDPFDLWVSADEVGVISIWSTKELPPWLPHKYQCLLRYRHTNRKIKETNRRPSASTVASASTAESFFLTESNNPDTSTGEATEKAEQEDEALPVRSLRWLPKEKTLALGDERGSITLLGFSDLLEEINEHRNGEAPSNPWSTDLLQVEKSWIAHSNSPICILFHCDYENQSVLVSSSENGQVFLWTLSGEKLGRVDEALTGQVTVAPWKVQLDLEKMEKQSQKEAAEMLQKVAGKKGPAVAKEEEVREPIALSTNNEPLSLPKSSGYELKIGVNPQDALVEWRSKQKQQVPIVSGIIPHRPSVKEGRLNSRLISSLFNRQLK